MDHDYGFLKAKRPSNRSDGIRTARKLAVSAFALMLVVTSGSAGFVVIEGMAPLDAVYMTVITLSTVGYGEVQPLHPAGRVLAMAVIAFGVVLGAYTAATLGELIIEGKLKEMFGRKKMDIRIRKLEGHTIIAGFGRVGRRVAAEFVRTGAPFVVIEKEPIAVHSLLDTDCLFVEGDATSETALAEAGIAGARNLISTLPDEAHNVYLTLTARHLNRSLNIIARADHEEGEVKLIRAGANHVVSPHMLGGIRMVMSALRPNVGDFMHMTSHGVGDLSIEEMVVAKSSRLSDKTIADSRLKQDFNVTILGLKKPGQKMSITPGPETVIGEGDTLILIGSNDQLEKLDR
jgi:voltage-gated potassium channel